VDGTNVLVVSRAAREAGLTVALSGLGADELFGGYASFRDVPRSMRFKRFGRFLPLRAIASLGQTRGLAKLACVTSRSDALSLYLLRRELFLPTERRELHPVPEGSDGESGLPVDLLDALRRRAAGLDAETSVSLFELELYMRNMLLRDADVFSMAAPIELRVPFLDHRLVETAFRLPGRWKRADPRQKPLLLDAVGPRLPRQVGTERKRGFTFPWGSWFGSGGPLSELARGAIDDRQVWADLGLDPQGVQAIGDRWWRGDRRISPLQILGFVSLASFTRRHGARIG